MTKLVVRHGSSSTPSSLQNANPRQCRRLPVWKTAELKSGDEQTKACNRALFMGKI